MASTRRIVDARWPLQSMKAAMAKHEPLRAGLLTGRAPSLAPPCFLCESRPEATARGARALPGQRQPLHSTFEGRRGEDALLPLLGRGALGLGRDKTQREAVSDGHRESLLLMTALGLAPQLLSEGANTHQSEKFLRKLYCINLMPAPGLS